MTASADLARQAMDSICSELTKNFLEIVEFSAAHPNLAVTRRKTKANPTPSSTDLEHFKFLAKKYHDGRLRKDLPEPKTVPDPALPIVMRHGYSIMEQHLADLIQAHRIAMVAENIVGELLERYLDSALNDTWIWCAGEVVKHVDFIRRSQHTEGEWDALQIKNRDNSENSSSSAIRRGTRITKWYRIKSRSGDTMWENFPIEIEECKLSEAAFQDFIAGYLLKIKE